MKSPLYISWGRSSWRWHRVNVKHPNGYETRCGVRMGCEGKKVATRTDKPDFVDMCCNCAISERKSGDRPELWPEKA